MTGLLRATTVATLLLHLLLLPAPRPAPGAEPAYLAELLAHADRLGLANSPGWHALLHYRPGRFGQAPKSEADAPEFFLAATGAADPNAELAATLRSFFAPADATGRNGEHPQCTFIARYRWLRETLGFATDRLTERPCAKFDEWRTAIAPASVTLVFPEAYMNNPSSMFGHTLLRFDTVAGGQRRDLLAYASNFAASTADDGAIAFAWKGIFGYYPGLFSLMPYYEKVREYADWEQRDLWEYELDLTPAETERLLEHLWEIRGINFFYYFFDENCSYRILRVLEVARPSLQLSSRFPWWAIPADTVRAVAGDAGLVRGVSFRPSATTELRHLANHLEPSERHLALRIASGARAPDSAEVAALPDRTRAAVLTVAHDIVRHTYVAGGEQRDPALGRARAILLARSKIPAHGGEVPRVPRPAQRPDQGHGSARVALGGGIRAARPFAEIGARPAFHDLLDPEGGYTAGAQIDFLQPTVRIYGDDAQVRLQRLAILDIISLAPRDDMFRPISWRFDTNVLSLLVPGRGDSGVRGLADRYVWRSHGGAGLARRAPFGGLAYAFVDGTFDIGSELDDTHALGLGGETGIFARPLGDRVALHASAAVRQFVTGADRTDIRAGVAQRISVNARHALRLGVDYRRDFGRDWIEAGLAWQLYF